jgi:hypothetical protein
MRPCFPFPLVVLALVGCSSSSKSPAPADDAGAEETSPSAEGCTELSIGAFRAGISGAGGASVVTNPTASLGGASPDLLSIELIPSGAAITTGSYDLAKETDYGTCRHCVALYVDGLDAGTSKTMFFQERGTLTLSKLSATLDAHSAGSIHDLKLVEVKVDPKSFATQKVAGGRCFTLKSASWSTISPGGGKCSIAADCSDTTSEICDPESGACVPGQCTSDSPCPVGKTCVYQAHGSLVGACHATCSPFAEGECPSDFECVISKFDGSAGYCKRRGSGAADAMCTRSDRDTGCVAGHVCDSVDGACRAQCDFFSDPSCPDGQRCVPPGVCTVQAFVDAKLGEPCAASAKAGDACGATDDALVGVCAGAPLKCAKWCRMSASDCESGQSCQPTTVPSLGWCG